MVRPLCGAGGPAGSTTESALPAGAAVRGFCSGRRRAPGKRAAEGFSRPCPSGGSRSRYGAVRIPHRTASRFPPPTASPVLPARSPPRGGRVLALCAFRGRCFHGRSEKASNLSPALRRRGTSTGHRGSAAGPERLGPVGGRGGSALPRVAAVRRGPGRPGAGCPARSGGSDVEAELHRVPARSNL